MRPADVRHYWIALAVAACAPDAASKHTVALTVPRTPDGPLTPEQHQACAAAKPAVDFLRDLDAGKSQPGEEDCAVRAGMGAITSCPLYADDFGSARAGALAKAHADVAAIHIDGGWALQVPVHGDTRVWELAATGPKLRYRLDVQPQGEFAAPRMFIDQGEKLTLVDLAAGTSHIAPAGARLLLDAPPFSFFSDEKHVLRLHAADLTPAGSVAFGDAWLLYATSLREGAVLASGDALVSFDKGSILRQGVVLGGARPDGARIMGCDGKAKAMVELDAETGATTATFPIQGGTATCETWMARSDAAYAADGRHVFWFEFGPQDKTGMTTIVVASGDTQTGSVRRLHDNAGTGTAGHLEAYRDGADDRLCVLMHATKSAWTACDWKMSANGKITRSPRRSPPSKPALADIGLKDALEAARATSPSGAHVAIATYSLPPSGDQQPRDLTLTLVGADGKVERTVVLMAGDFPLDTSGMVADNMMLGGGTFMPPPRLVFQGETRVSYDAPYFRCNAVDVTSGEVHFEHPRFAEPRCTAPETPNPDPVAIYDPLHRTTVRLVASEAEWAAAPFLISKCPAK